MVDVARIWAKHLFGHVPEIGLDEAFKFAFARHTTGFAVTPQEIKAGWRSMQSEYARDQAMAAAENGEGGEYITLPSGAIIRICPVCNNTGFEYVQLCNEQGEWHEGVIKRMDCCNYWPRRRAAAPTFDKI